MSKLNVNAIEPSTGTDITLGASGDTITVPSGATFTQSGTMNASAITAGTLAIAQGGTGAATLAAAGLANTPAFLARNDAAQSISADTATKVTFGTEEYDTDSAFATSKFTVPAGKAGKYFIYSKVQQDCTANTHLRLGIYKNGAEIGRTFTGEADNDEFTSWSGAIDLSAADYIEIYIFQNADGGGASRDVRTSGSLLYTYFGGYKIIGA